MTETPEKKEACPAKARQQSSPATGQITSGEGIPLCKKDKKILRRVSRGISDVFASLDEIENNIERNERALYLKNLRSLLEGICAMGLLPKALTPTIRRAKAMGARP